MAPSLAATIARDERQQIHPCQESNRRRAALQSVTPATRSLLRIATLTLVAAASEGCYSDSAAFITRAAKLSCVNARECEHDAYAANYDTMHDCREAAEDVLHEEFDPLEGAGCEYIAENGRECIHAMFKIRKQCNVDLDAALSDACDAVFVCPPGAGRVGAFPMGGLESIERAGQLGAE